jgi:hypothetical protein
LKTLFTFGKLLAYHYLCNAQLTCALLAQEVLKTLPKPPRKKKSSLSASSESSKIGWSARETVPSSAKQNIIGFRVSEILKN